MPVYVDDAFIPFGNVPYQMKVSHLIADTAAELHDVADRVGLKRKWFQANASTPHYDISKGLRERAIKEFGVIPLNLKSFAAKLRELRPRVRSGAWDSDPPSMPIFDKELIQ